MERKLEEKCSVEAIRRRFDRDVERFSDLSTGQVSTVDAPLAMELITQAALAVTPGMRRMLDIGCGAGNNTLKLLECVPSLDCDLLDLSWPMLERALARVSRETGGEVRAIQSDFRIADLEDGAYDVVIAAAVFHHLRDDGDWRAAFQKLYRITAPGGSVWITDLVRHENPAVQSMMWERYGSYLEEAGGREYRGKVFEYIDFEDSPRPLCFQLELLRAVGFDEVDILHKNSCFAAFGAVRRAEE